MNVVEVNNFSRKLCTIEGSPTRGQSVSSDLTPRVDKRVEKTYLPERPKSAFDRPVRFVRPFRPSAQLYTSERSEEAVTTTSSDRDSLSQSTGLKSSAERIEEKSLYTVGDDTSDTSTAIVTTTPVESHVNNRRDPLAKHEYYWAYVSHLSEMLASDHGNDLKKSE